MKYFEKVGDIFNCNLILEDGTEFIIPMREDGYIFATALCKVVGKKISHWLNLKETKEFKNKLEKSDAGIPVSQLIEVYKGNSDKYNQGTWIHPNLGIKLAQWCSPNFSLQVSKWIRELIITNKVELGKEKNTEEIQEEFTKIIKALKEKITELENSNKELENNNKELENSNKELENIDKKIKIIKDEETKKEEKKESKQVYREINKVKKAECDKKYREKNRDKLLVKQKDYRDTHKEQVSTTKKDWYKKNKEKVINRIKQNYEKNKEHKIEKVKEYAEKNKEKIKERNANTITCECGVTLRKYGLKKHLETTNHKEKISLLTT
jgi:hypothetical protein